MSGARCTILTDSNSDLPYDYYGTHNVEVIHMPYMIDDVEYKDDLGKSLSNQEFYKRLESGAYASTSQTHVSDLYKGLEDAAKKGLPIVFICFSSGLSGTFDRAAEVVAQFTKEHPEQEVFLIDSLLASAAQGYLVYKAVELRDSGASAEEIYEWALEALYSVNGYFTLDSLEHLRRGGRIPDVAAYAGAKLDIKPILKITTDGKLAFDKVARGRKKSLAALVDKYKKRHVESTTGNTETVIVVHTNVPKDAEQVVALLKKENEDLNIILSEIGPVIGSHVGPGMVAIVFWGTDRRGRNGGLEKAQRKGQERIERAHEKAERMVEKAAQKVEREAERSIGAIEKEYRKAEKELEKNQVEDTASNEEEPI